MFVYGYRKIQNSLKSLHLKSAFNYTIVDTLKKNIILIALCVTD